MDNSKISKGFFNFGARKKVSSASPSSPLSSGIAGNVDVQPKKTPTGGQLPEKIISDRNDDSRNGKNEDPDTTGSDNIIINDNPISPQNKTEDDKNEIENFNKRYGFDISGNYILNESDKEVMNKLKICYKIVLENKKKDIEKDKKLGLLSNFMHYIKMGPVSDARKKEMKDEVEQIEKTEKKNISI